jgi:hypothetical protein
MPFGQVVEETRRAAKELAAASLKLGRSAIDEAKKAGRDVPGTVRKVVRRVEEDLDHAKDEIKRALDDKK